MTSLHRHFHCFLKILIFIAGGNDSFVVKNKFRAFWCLICLCSWIRSYLPPGHGRTVTSSAVTRSLLWCIQSYVIKSAPWTILWFRILGIFSVEYIKRLRAFMFKSCSNSQLLRRVLWISAEQTIGASLKHKNTQPLYMFNRVRVLHLNRLKERTWLHSFG